MLAAGMGVAALGAMVYGPANAARTSTEPPPLPPPDAKPGSVAIERRGPLLLIGIDRPWVQNRIDAPVQVGLAKAYYQLEHDDAVRAGVLYGVGSDFSLGLDVRSFLAGTQAGILPPKGPDTINPYQYGPAYRTKPLVVAVQGGVWYGAHELFLAADVRVAATDVVFDQGEAVRGIFPGGGATVRFTREAGWGNAMRYMLTGDTWGAEEALRMGTVQAVTPPGRQLDKAVEIAQRIATLAPLGVRAIMESARQGIAAEEPALAAIRPKFLSLFQTRDFEEVRRAAQEHRRPVFQGS
jgi:enoyl-CoA hydratase/carnithine racemase